MTDSMKESLFSALGDLGGMKVLDLYAGSGALGLESLSRGAKQAVFVENAREAIVKLEANIEVTKFEGATEILWADTKMTLGRPADDRMDLVFVDPPYNMALAHVRNDLEAIVTQGWLADDGRIVVHRMVKEAQLKPFGLELMWEREYGQSRILVFTHEEEAE
jgi:16S rRNA (guanine966-N2)-methyltransferase